VRAVLDLVQLSDVDLFVQISRGLELVLRNACRLAEDAGTLGRLGRGEGARVLRLIAEEEAAKFLILLDAVRCPRQPSCGLARQLRRFCDHLAKGIYAACCYWRVGSLGQLLSYVEAERRDFYSAGPDDSDPIFRNRILLEREMAIYVDYVATDDGGDWLLPFEGVLSYLDQLDPPALRIARAFHAVGCTTPQALELIAATWRPVQVGNDFTLMELRKVNQRTLEAMGQKGLLRERLEDSCRLIIQEWPFPLYSADLKMTRVTNEGRGPAPSG
jgi:AbiV family abortive infection protein